MGTITGFTATRLLQLEADTVIGGHVAGDSLILEQHDGSTIDAGSVRGPQGIQGVPGEGFLPFGDIAAFVGTPLIQGGVQSVTTNGAGDFTLTFDLPFPTAGWFAIPVIQSITIVGVAFTFLDINDTEAVFNVKDLNNAAVASATFDVRWFAIGY